MKLHCRICNSENIEQIELISFRPKIYKSKWDYLICKECGTLQINTIPVRMDTLYDSTYESFTNEKRNTFKDKIFSKRYEACIKNSRTVVGRIVNLVYPYGNYTFLGKIEKEDYILDVGCGGGYLLKILYKHGYHNCRGIDPFLEHDILVDNNFVIEKTDIFSFNDAQKYDVIMLNHVFEHMENPDAVLMKIKSLLQTNGMLSIEIPIINDFLWEKYGIYIDSLDPPFHYYLYTEDSMRRLLERNGFEIEEYYCNISPLLETFANSARSENVEKRTLIGSAMLTLKLLIRNRQINKAGNGNIARFICRIANKEEEQK